MDILKIVGIALATTLAVLVLKASRPEFAAVAGIAGGIVIILMILNQLSQVFEIFQVVSEKSGLSKELFASVLKIVGIGYLTEFSASICSDAGSPSIGEKILLAGKVVILVVALPIVTNLIEIVARILP